MKLIIFSIYSSSLILFGILWVFFLSIVLLQQPIHQVRSGFVYSITLCFFRLPAQIFKGDLMASSTRY
ncbi:hypothetical protein Hanom_Chr06g00509941 [Helianthus anomalus]